MVKLEAIEQQLQAIGVKAHFWNRPEIVELQHILLPGEVLEGAVNGRYEGGFATLFVTDQRILLVDKKLLHLSVEDMRYDMISEVDFGSQLMSGTLRICTPTKTLSFASFKPAALRAFAFFIQQRVIEIRQQYAQQAQVAAQQQAQAWAPQPAASPQVQKSAIPQAPFIDPRTAFVAENETPTQAAPQQHIEKQIEQQMSQPMQPSALQMPQLGRNPYTATPLMIRRRVGRFTGIPQPRVT